MSFIPSLQYFNSCVQTPPIKSNWFQQTVLAPENFGRFNDDIIQASILRAADPFEMNFADAPNESRELGRLIRRIVDAAHQDRGGAAAEFLLALATKRLRLHPSDTTAILDRKTTGLAMVDFLLDVCRKLLIIHNLHLEPRSASLNAQRL